jgi:hypothetical protein
VEGSEIDSFCSTSMRSRAAETASRASACRASARRAPAPPLFSARSFMPPRRMRGMSPLAAFLRPPLSLRALRS